jgi:hypothetical protein
LYEDGEDLFKSLLNNIGDNSIVFNDTNKFLLYISENRIDKRNEYIKMYTKIYDFMIEASRTTSVSKEFLSNRYSMTNLPASTSRKTRKQQKGKSRKQRYSKH